MPLPVVDTRRFFRPLSREVVAVLRAAGVEGWQRPTLAGAWQVRDVAAHLCDTALRRLSFQRDRSSGAPGPRPDQDFVAFINELNATWVGAARRLSPRVLTDLYAQASGELAAFMETLDLDAPAFFPVSWAGEDESRQWLDVGREFTEVWHHGAQIRDALDAGPFSDPRWLLAVLQIAMHALPHGYRDVTAPSGAAIAIRVSGPASGAWSLHRRDGTWIIDESSPAAPAATVTMADETAWRLFFNALSPPEIESRIVVEGDAMLAGPLLRTRSVIV
ncbi:MAG TPA: maleylpyruvate isomerase N-terminal domain-containing protein [Vicinamibacterales bacterium]|nr:maleylpyruvate isomerase N-terminal domain-containing protein [Vicinamibacterales bacterium]